MSESFKSLFEASLKETEMRVGKLVHGMVVLIENDYVWVDAGLKSEAIIPIEQFKDENGELTVDVGSAIDVVLDAIDNSWGETRLSRDKAKRIETWAELEKLCESGEIIKGRIVHHVRGGYTAEVRGLRAFLPGSLIDVRPLRDISHLENIDIELKVIKMDAKRNNIVVSRRAVIESEYLEEREAMMERLAEGALVKGVVKNITDFGAFIDLNGIDGLLHITDMSWSRIKHPSDVLTIGEEIDVKVIKFDAEKNRVSLGIKQLVEDPWTQVTQELEIGQKLTGHVTNITDYGCFVKIKDGVEGLVHASEMDWANKNTNPHKMFTLGQEVNVMILEIDSTRHRISLGIKQCTVNPWHDFAEKYKLGDKVVGKVCSITDFGLFVALEGGIDALIHLSDLSWTQTAEEISKTFKKGDDIEAVVLSVDIERERIALGLKQLESDPFTTYLELHDKGAVVKGMVTSVQQNGAVVELATDVEGFIRVSDIAREHVEDARNTFKVNEEVEAKIVTVDKRRRRIALSIRALTEDLDKTSKADYKADAVAPTTIGDLIKEQMKK